MPIEKMTAIERIEAAVKLKPVDRIPCAPFLDFYFPAKYMGLSVTEAIGNWKKRFYSIVEVFDEVGGWDGIIISGSSVPVTPHAYSALRLGKSWILDAEKRDDAPLQFREKMVLTQEDYDDIIDLGWHGYELRNRGRFSTLREEEMINWAENQMQKFKFEVNFWKERGIRTLCGAMVFSPLMILSTSRTLLEITKDIYRIPDKLEAVMEAMIEDLISDSIEATRLSGVPGVMLVMERGGCFYYPLKIYERFEYPHMKRMVEAFAREGIITVMHLDQDYTLNLPYFKDLPPKMVVAELDSITDIFKAKEILKGHMCIAGDVPAALSSLGTPEEMEEYCKKLIDLVGKDSGFILSTGCICPIDCKMRNFKAMVNIAKNYYPH